jgi:hypothetical protein
LGWTDSPPESKPQEDNAGDLESRFPNLPNEPDYETQPCDIRRP